jgi:hypothetical protein
MLQTQQREVAAEARLSPPQVAVLVAAPIVAIVARLMLTPWLQDDADQLDSAQLLSEVADSAVRNDIGATVALISCALYAGAAVVIGGLARTSAPRVGLVGQALAVAGAFGMAAFYGQASIVPQAAREEDREAMISLLDRCYDAVGTNLSYLVAVAGALGWLLLGYALYRARTVPRGAAVVTTIGSIGVLLTAPGPLRPFIVGAAVISLVGLAWVVAAARRR